MRKIVGSTVLSVIFFLANYSLTSAQVVINEFESWKATGDWIELYAIEDTDISGWVIKDATSVVKTLPNDLKIGPSTSQYYLVEAGNRLNKDEDTIKLLKADNTSLMDQIGYGGSDNVCAPGENESIGRYPDANSVIERFKSSSKGSSNNNSHLSPCPIPTDIPDSPTSTSKPSTTMKPSPTPKPTNTVKPSVTAKHSVTQIPTKGAVNISNTRPIELTSADKNTETGGAVIGETYVENSKVPTETKPVSGVNPKVLGAKSERKIPVLAMALIILGVVAVGISLSPIIKNLYKRYNHRDEVE